MSKGSEVSSSRGSDSASKEQGLYLMELISDKKRFEGMPDMFTHAEKLLDEEIVRVRKGLFNLSDTALELPEAEGSKTFISQKVYIPVKEFPSYNFVGRILGPGGTTSRQISTHTGCQILIRGRGSMRNQPRENHLRGTPGWEHLSDNLHVLVTVEDTENRARIRLKKAVERVKELLIPTEDDELKKLQLMELAIMKGTYRDKITRNTKNQMEVKRGSSAVESVPYNNAPLPLNMPPQLPLVPPLMPNRFCNPAECNPFSRMLMPPMSEMLGMGVPSLNTSTVMPPLNMPVVRPPLNMPTVYNMPQFPENYAVRSYAK